MTAYGYIPITLCSLGLLACIARIWNLQMGRKEARGEKTVRLTGVTFLMVTLGYFFGYIDWAYQQPYVFKNGRYMFDVSTTASYTLFFVVMPGAILGVSLYGISFLIRRKRINRVSDRYFAERRAVSSEYGPDADKIVKRSGLHERWRRTLMDYF